MENLLLLLIVPICFPLISKYMFGHTITWQEVGIQAGSTALFVMLAYGAGSYTSTYDTEIFNGEIVSKSKDYTSCSHSYSCRCRPVCSGSGQTESCSVECDTCYEHSNDWNWTVDATVGSYYIDRIDSRGSNEPPRWTEVVIGEPASKVHSYTNYIKAAPDSLYAHVVNYEQFDAMIPPYPKIHDYYRINRVLGFESLDANYVAELNNLLNVELKTLAVKKEVNIVVVFANTADSNFRYALEKKWSGGKKNDVIIVIGVIEFPKINWVDVITLGSNSGNEYMSTVLRDTISKLILDNPQELGHTITSTIEQNFSRKPMEDFEYLKDDIDPPIWLMVIILVISIAINVVLTYNFRRN